MSSEAPWGYLLPLREGPPPLELTHDSATVGTSDKCTLQVNGTLLGLPAGSAPQTLFTVRRDESDDSVFLRCESDVVQLNKKKLQRGCEETLQHGARIALAAVEVTYVFVNREKSASFIAPPDVLDKYLVGHLLGCGGFGKVYILFDKSLNYHTRALKVVEPKSEEHLPYVEREARILMTLNHPCVINTFSIGQFGRQQFLVMEYMEGGDLRQFVNGNRHLTEEQTKIIFCQLALAVKYLHEKGICHRDLKPANIVLQQRSPNTLIKVTDFGFAKDKNNDSSMKSFAGTNHYVAPEMINEDKYTNSVDVWSMGVILFYSLTGTLPFKSLDDAVRRRHVVIYEGHCWRGVTSLAQQLVKKMLKVKVADRASVSQVIEDPWLRDEVTREKIFRLTGLEEYRTRPADLSGEEWRSDKPWGYLLPLRDGPLPTELREDRVTVRSSDDGKQGAEATVFFKVIRKISNGSVHLRSESDVVRLNGNPIKRGREEELPHGALISFDAEEATYVYVDREESDSLIAPQEVQDKYLIGHSLGGGAFGKVHILFDKKNYQRKALKIVKLKNETQLQFAERKAKILITLKHPCVIATFSMKSRDHVQFLVMEYQAGGDLTQFVNDQRLLSEAQTKLLFFQLALAVQYLHSRNIFHRDLEPGNILLQHCSPYTLIKVKISVKPIHYHRDPLYYFPTMTLYTAPEVFNDKYTKAVDVWSMGVILFYSLTGSLPFKSLDGALRRGHTVIFDPERWRGVSWQAQNIVRSLLKVQVTDRLPAERVVQDPWLQDDEMRENAYHLTGLKDIQPRPTSRPSPSAAPALSAATPTPLRWAGSGSRAVQEYMQVLEYMQVGTDPDGLEKHLSVFEITVRRSCLQTLRARPLLLGAIILVGVLVVASVAFGLLTTFL